MQVDCLLEEGTAHTRNIFLKLTKTAIRKRPLPFQTSIFSLALNETQPSPGENGSLEEYE
jgi:hypothetical protein